MSDSGRTLGDKPTRARSEEPRPSKEPPPRVRTVAEIARQLAEPFARSEIKFKPQIIKGDKALALAYIDARLVQDRLDEVLGVVNWQDEYELLPDGSAICRLRCRINEEWLAKMDVGSPSEQPDAGDRVKAAFSDALKRAAVKYGIGRYLYRLPTCWVPYDSVKRVFLRPPQLPEWAYPRLQKNQELLKQTLQQAAADEGKAILPEQLEEIERLAHLLGTNFEQTEARLQELYGKSHPKELTAQQGLDLIGRLEGKLATKEEVEEQRDKVVKKVGRS